MSDRADETASIDMAMAFFSAVLVLFVFVKFNTVPDPREPVKVSTGQTVPTVTSWPATWQTINRRGGFGLYVGKELVVFDMSAIGEGLVDKLKSAPVPGQSGLSPGFAGSAPESFDLLWGFVPATPPEAWQDLVIPATQLQDGACPDGMPSALNVFVWAELDDLTPLMRFAERCGLGLRFELFDPKRGLEKRSDRAVALQPRSYQGERVFR